MTNELIPTQKTPDIKFVCHFGFVKLYEPMPVFDNKGRVIGYTQRITDSNGRDEILPPIVRINYGG